MTKQELMENYTMEQLADMVISLKSDLSKKENVLKIKTADCKVSKDGDTLQVMCSKCGERFIAFLDNKYTLCTKAKFFGIQDANKQLNTDIAKLQNTINQIDDILEKLFGVRHDVGKPNEFKEILKEKIYGNITIEDFLPEEPIKVADILINATYTREKGDIEKRIHKSFGNDSDTVIENTYSVSKLRQIAEHLLIYCNNQKGE